jgi:hypothetical protein
VVGFLGLPIIEELLQLVACTLELARQDVGVTAQGYGCSVGLALRRFVAHEDGCDFGADASVIQPGRGGVAGVLDADRFQAAVLPNLAATLQQVADVEPFGLALPSGRTNATGLRFALP